MIEESDPLTDQVKVICQIPNNVNVYDMCFDWSGKKLAVACSDKKVRIYERKPNGQWSQQNPIKTQGPAVWKVKWARPEFGVIVVTCSRDSVIRIHNLKRKDWSDSKKNEWNEKPIIKEKNKGIQDLKFIPHHKFGLIIGYVSANESTLKLISAKDQKEISTQISWDSEQKIQITEYGLNCLSWSKEMKKYSVIAVGCKSHETTIKRGFKYSSEMEPKKLQPINTIAFVAYKNNELERIQCPSIKETKAVNDISWALVNGRSYSILGVASDAYTRIYQIGIKQNGQSIQLDMLTYFNLGEERPCYRLTFNIMGTVVAVAEKKKVRLFKAIQRSSWGEIKMIQDIEK